MEHYSLLNLGLEEFCRYVADIFIRLLQLSQKSMSNDFITCYLHPTCKILEDHIQNNLPSDLSNKVTELVLKLIVEILNNLEYYNIHQKDEETMNLITEIAVQVACASSHHSVSSFQSQKITQDYRNMQIFDFTSLYIEQMLKKSQSFRELHIVKFRLSGSLPPLDKLESWVSRSTTDEILNVLSTSSKNLKHLDFSGSYCGLSDKSIDYILKFCNLRYLKLIYTSLSIEGIERLIRGFKISENNVPLKNHLMYFGVIVQPSFVYLIPECLTNLTSLNLHLLSFIDLTPLKKLKLLTGLTVTTKMDQNMFSCIQNLIQEAGHRLLELKLEMEYLNLKIISECCPVLRKLSIKCCFGLSEHISLKFESVQDLEVSTFETSMSEFLVQFLPQFPNLKKLKLWMHLTCQERHPTLQMLLYPLKTRAFNEITLVSQLNCITAELEKECVKLTNNMGYSVTVSINELENTMLQALENGIQNLGRKYRIISS
ncbi:hypothetical protein L9F63_012807 [Diploptera punctata]|uniref:Uncharacterized protein n=1 Tax=Diploptera punctata TaxID=6984 RepID=A0AAD8ABE3_DIPPU|nr:hypothetical protein L9F63_012807 [Diploptera punctata]